uniref:Peptidase M14 carboxypeptidase A domain-containing protein n=1 Tax=Ascaris lumbricoides TaxID=6252 RepID=A0A9J2PSI8_ASCLU
MWQYASLFFFLMRYGFQLVEHYDKDPQMRNFVNNLDWYIVPLLNPDGYEYSRSSTNPEIRLWRKNRSPPVCIETRSSFFAAVQTRCCQGVDLNRNFDWDFGVEGSSTDPCSEIYQGAYAFSEPETRAVRDFISGRHGQVRTFLTFHSYSQILMYPFGHQVRTYTNDVYDLRSTALHAASALRSLYGTTYVVGTGADTLYPASGGSEDWAKGRMGVKYSYLFELRPEEQVWDGFLLAENQIIPTSRETFEAVKVIATHTLETAQSNIRRAPPSRDFTDIELRGYVLQTCVDRNPNCGYWARNGACSSANAESNMGAHLVGLLLTLVSSVHPYNTYSEGGSDERFKVLRLQTENIDQFLTVKKLFDSSTLLRVNFWKTARDIEDISDVMVPSSTIDQVLQMLNEGNVNVTTTIDDVEKLIIDREKNRDYGYAKRLKDDPNVPKYDFYTYGSYPQMVSWMRALARQYPNIVQFISIGKSHEGRSIDGLEIGGGNNRTKRVFWIDGGIHAREWAAPHTALYFIHQLTSKYGRDATITNYVDNLTWVIVPCLNPDGYEFTRSSTNPNVRTSAYLYYESAIMRLRFDFGGRTVQNQYAIAINGDAIDVAVESISTEILIFISKRAGQAMIHARRYIKAKQRSVSLKHGYYMKRSVEMFSAVRDAILSNRYRGRIDGFITLHTYSQIWIHPYGHRRDTYPGDIQDLYDVGKKATNALSKLYGTKYVVGSGADTLYPASGGSEDWAKQTAAIKYVYLLELRPDERNWDGFILDEHQLIPTASETWAGVRVVADAVIERINKRTSRLAGRMRLEW